MISETQLTQVLQDKFGFDHFREGQLPVLQSVLNGQDTLAVLPTGAGKTLLYQLPGYLLKGSILIVSPLLSLMQDQVARLQMSGQKKVVMLSSMQNFQERQAALNHLQQFKYIFASPEVLAQDNVKQALMRIELGLFVIDEAHCVSQWGPDFRPEYLMLKQLLTLLHMPPVLMLTATAPKKVQQDIIDKLGLTDQSVNKVIQSVDRPNIYLATQKLANEQEKNGRLVQLLNQIHGRGIVYFSSRKQATQIAQYLQEHQINAQAYHAGISATTRYKLLHQFMHNDIDVICATSAFGMGIDKDDIRFVIHYHLPANIENYVQEIGRAGRDGQQSLAVLLYSVGDEFIPRRLKALTIPSNQVIADFVHGRLKKETLGDLGELLDYYVHSGQSETQINESFKQSKQLFEEKLQRMLDYANAQTCLRQQILQYFDEQVNQHEENCCNFTTHEISNDILAHLPQEKQLTKTTPLKLNWRNQLSKLFFVNS